MRRILATLVVLFCAMSQGGVAANDSASGTVGYEAAVVGYLRPVLESVGAAARIYYAGECRAAEFDTFGTLQLRFPRVLLHTPAPGSTGIDAIRQIFREDPNVAVTQDRSGTVRITIGSVSTALLQTTIQTLQLSPRDQFNATLALLRIENLPEFDEAEHRLNVYSVFKTIDIIVEEPIPGRPHLPGLMQNITVDAALDSVSVTFGYIVTYGICKQPDGKSLFKIGFAYG